MQSIFDTSDFSIRTTGLDSHVSDSKPPHFHVKYRLGLGSKGFSGFAGAYLQLTVRKRKKHRPSRVYQSWWIIFLLLREYLKLLNVLVILSTLFESARRPKRQKRCKLIFFTGVYWFSMRQEASGTSFSSSTERLSRFIQNDLHANLQIRSSRRFRGFAEFIAGCEAGRRSQ